MREREREKEVSWREREEVAVVVVVVVERERKKKRGFPSPPTPLPPPPPPKKKQTHRSLTELLGCRLSSFASTTAPSGGTDLRSLTSGVPPIRSTTDSTGASALCKRAATFPSMRGVALASSVSVVEGGEGASGAGLLSSLALAA